MIISKNVVDCRSLRPRFRSQRIANFTESVIREMTRLAMRYGATNLAQGFPDFPAPEALKRAAAEAIDADINQYSITWGAKPFRDAIAAKYARHYAMEFDPEREITVCCGATEGMIAAMLAVHRSGRRGGALRAVLRELQSRYAALRRRSRATSRCARRIGASTATNCAAPSTRAPRPSSSIRPTIPPARYSRARSCEFIAGLCQEFDALAITDEIYEHIVYDGAVHMPIISLPGMRERSILVNSMSKTYSVTGWRVGWVLAPPDLTDSIRKVHDFLTVGAASPLQQAGRDGARHARRLLRRTWPPNTPASAIIWWPRSRPPDLRCSIPRGAYYMMADISAFGFPRRCGICPSSD